MLLKKQAAVNTKIFCQIRYVWGIQWIEFKVETIEYELIKSAFLTFFF